MEKFYQTHVATGGRRRGISLPLLLVTALLGLMLLSSPGICQETKAPASEAAKPAASTSGSSQIHLRSKLESGRYLRAIISVSQRILPNKSYSYRSKGPYSIF
jgi:hypothetical protein